MKILKRAVTLLMTALLLFTAFSANTVTLAAGKKISSIKLNKTNLTVYIGNTYKLTATVLPTDASNKKLTWSTSDKNIVTVSSGKITGKKAGSATVTAKAQDGSGKKAVCKITVKKQPVKSVTLNKTKAIVYVGSSLTLKATVSPENATNKKVTWKSSNTNVAVVNANGKITAKKAGTVTISVLTIDGNKKAVCKVTVKKQPVKSVALNKTKATLYTGEKLTLKATINPSNATNKKITWTSSNSKVAVVNENGIVTAKKNGTVTISAVTADGNKKAVCKITVKNYYTVEGSGVNLASTDKVWIPTNGGKKFHKTSACSSMVNPKKVTVKVAVESGFSACKRCYK